MSLNGRLEDLPVADILRIVYLSRGSGTLEIASNGARRSVLFRRGLILNVSTPEDPSLRRHLESKLSLAPLAQLGESEIPIGVAVLEMNLIKAADLSKIVYARIAESITALCAIGNGEFSFRAGDPAPMAVEYEPKSLFRHGGILPEKILGRNPMQLASIDAVKGTLAAGKRTLSAPAKPSALPRADRTVVLLESDARLQEAVRNALALHEIEVVACSDASLRDSVSALLDAQRPFVTVLDIDPAPQHISWRVLDLIKARSSRLPVVVMDREASFRRRHVALQAGADLYLIKPQPPKNRIVQADEELALFAEDVAAFAARHSESAEKTPDAAPPAADDKERMVRGFRLLMQLISEMSEPNDISQLALTILQLATDHVDRGVLFAVTPSEYATLGRFGLTGNGPANLRLGRGEMAILDRVLETRQPYRGSVDVSTADQQLLNSFGGLPPTEIVVLPITNGDEIVGILYGDNAVNRRAIDDTVGLEVFLSQAGCVFQNAILASRTRGAVATEA